jgi:phage terminase large subunit-like protein
VSPEPDPVTDYARRVTSGEIPAGKWQIASCNRHLKDLDASKHGGPYEYREDLADKAFQLFSLCRHYKGEWAGMPIRLEPWQQFVVGCLMGWVHRGTNLRRFRHAFVELPRGQGKSTIAGGLLVIFAFFLGEGGAESYSVATKKDQARISFQAGRQMLLRSPALKKHVTISKYNVHSMATESKMEALGSDADTLDGLRPFFVCVDEVHKLPSQDIVDVMVSGMGTRLNPMLFLITTAGDDDQSVYGQYALLTQRVLDGTIDLPDWFGFIAAADPEDDWTVEATWRKANPNFGISVKPEFIASEVRKALANPAEQAKVRRLYLGQKVSAVEGYFSMDDWKACPHLPDDEELMRHPCWIGLDLSSSIDVTAAVLVWKLPNEEFACQPHFWLPADNLEERGHRDRVPYQMYVPKWLQTTEGNTIDRPRVRREVAALAKLWHAKAVCYDPWHAPELVQALQDEDGVKCTPIPQSYQMLSSAMKDLQAHVLKRRIRHDHNPLMHIMMSNTIPRADEKGNVMPSKKRSRGRIDGVQATLNVFALMAREQQPQIQVFFMGRP